MSWLTDIFTSSVSTVIDSVGNAVDKLVTSDEENLQLKNELVKIQLEATLKANEQANEAEAQITERWKSDNEHIVTRLVRPVSSAWLIGYWAIGLVVITGVGKEVYDYVNRSRHTPDWRPSIGWTAK